MSDLLRARAAVRTFALEDMTVRSDGGGRIVESYFAVFGSRAEVMDVDGHYLEENARSAFTKTLRERGLDIPVFYNHARTLDGTPAAEFTIPIGKPVEIRADERGVFNAVRYLENPLADQVLNGVKEGVIRGMSYSGRFLKSTKARPTRRGELPVITRSEVALREFGPTAIPAFREAEIVGYRTQAFLEAILAAPKDRRVELIKNYEGLEPLLDEEPDPLGGTPAGAATRTEEPGDHSARSNLRTRIRAARIARGME